MKSRLFFVRIAIAATALSVGTGVAFGSSSVSAAGYCSSPGVGVAETSDDTPSAQPTVTFKYTITTPRTSPGNMLFYALKPSGFTFANKTNAELGALLTVKVNGVTQTPGIFYTGNGGIYANAVIDVRIAVGYSLLAGDQVELIIASGAITNPSTSGNVTWVWRTADGGGRDEQCYSATMVYVDPTATTTTTTTTLAATTTTVAATTTLPGVTTTTDAPTETTLAPEPLENRTLPNLPMGGSSFTIDGKDTPLIVTSSGGEVQAEAGEFSVAVAGSKGGSPVPLAVGAGQKLPAGSSLSVTGKGFKNGTKATLWLVNSKTLLGNATVNADGTVVLSGDLASSLAPGTYTIQVAGTGADGKVRAVSLGFTITAPAEELTSTGARSDMWILVAIALVMLGVLATNGRIVRDEV